MKLKVVLLIQNQRDFLSICLAKNFINKQHLQIKFLFSWLNVGTINKILYFFFKKYQFLT